MSLKLGLFTVFTAGAIFMALPNNTVVAQNGPSMIEFVKPEDLMRTQKPEEPQLKTKVIVKPKNNYAPVDVLINRSNVTNRPLGYTAPDDVAPSRSFINQPKASYALGSGDTIKVTVFGEKELSNDYLVNEEGYIFMPLIGEINAKGRTVEDVINVIEARLSEGYLIDPSVAIEISDFRPIYVMGEVKTPGSFDFVTDMTIRNAVAIAGGFTYRANQKKIHVLRETSDGKTHRIKDVPPDRKIQPGDIIEIRERFF